jgi:hypothetical protein
MAGDYKHFQRFYRDRSTTSIALAATDYSTATSIITPKNTSSTLYIQKIVVTITTYSAKTWTFQDSTGTPVPIAVASIPAAAPTTGGDASFVFDWGPDGIPLTEGKNLDFKMSAAGAAGVVHVEAYEKLTAVVAAASTN